MLADQIEHIINKEQDIVPFLKSLTPAQKKELVPFLKKFKEKIFEEKAVTEKSKWGISYISKPIHSEAKRALVSKACYVCFNKTDIKKTFFNVSQLSISDDYLENIIPWYTPEWYNDLINETMPWGLKYEKMMDLYKKDLLKPSQALILARLPQAIVESKWENNKHQAIYKPEVLLKYPETLNEHIWLLFEAESGIHSAYHYLNIENYKGDHDIWIETITNLANESKLERQKLLIATIYSSTKGFNKTLSGWFFDLLIKLNPTPDEVLSLQNEFFAALNSPHSKVINTVLKYFKLIAHHKKFKYTEFIENASIPLNSDTKSVVHSTLMILEKIAKTHKTSSIAVCKRAAEALINIDEKIQLRAAKIIEKYGDPISLHTSNEIVQYADHIFHSTRDVLKEYIIQSVETDEAGSDCKAEKTNLLSEENKLPAYETLDDFIFFLSQSIDNNEDYHIDLLLSYLPKLNTLLNKSNVANLEPVFTRAFDLSMRFEWHSQIGKLETQAAYFINDFAEMLLKKYPVELVNFKKSKDQKIEKLKEDRYFNSHYQNRLKAIEHQLLPDYIYQIHHSLFTKSKTFIQKELKLDLLSTPTHNPCWIDPEILINRIVSYEKSNEEINLYDFQIAIGRLPINETPKDFMELIENVRNDEIKNILKYHYGNLDIKSIAVFSPELWLQSVLSRNIESEMLYFQDFLANPLNKATGTYNWDCKSREHFYKEYDYPAKKYVQKKIIRQELRFYDSKSARESESFISGLKSLFQKKKQTIKVDNIYENMHFKKREYQITIQPNDDVKFLFLVPNNPGKLLSQVLQVNLKESTFSNEVGKKNMTNLLKGLHQIWFRADFNETTYLFLASGMLCSDKVARDVSAEIWIKANSENNLNNSLLGQILGKLEKGEYAPLKRFTDLLTVSLFNVSKKHNELLYCLIENMIGNMHPAPIRGLAKLLEIFLELRRTLPETELRELAKEKLSEWKNANNLKALISRIEQ